MRRTYRQDVYTVTKTMGGSDCWSDHRLVVSKLNLRILPARRPQGKKAPKRLDFSKLNLDSMRQAFMNGICNNLGAMNHSSAFFQNVVHSSAANTLGHPTRKRKKTGLTRMMKKCIHFLKKTPLAKGTSR